MKIIYDGEKHRSVAGAVGGMALGAVFVAIAIAPLFDTKPIGAGWAVFALAFAGFGIWTAVEAFRLSLRGPIDVSVLDSGVVQVRERSGELISLPARQFRRIEYVYTGHDGTLYVTADTHDWSWLVSEDETEEIIAALHRINPSIRVKRVEGNPGG